MTLRARNLAFDFIDPQVVSEIRNDPVAFFSRMQFRQLKIFNCLLYWSNQGLPIYLRQDTLAKFAGYLSREHVNRLIARFKELGLIATDYRHKTSCLYKISSFFNDMQLRSKLKKYLSQLAYLPIALLEPNVTQYISNYIYISNQAIDSSLRTRTRIRTREEKTPGRVVVVQNYVEEIQNPVLSLTDKQTLSRYSEKAVRHALIQLQRQKDIKNPVGFMVVCCKTYEERNNKAISTNAMGFDSHKKEMNSVAYQQYQPTETRDMLFWKQDMDKMAHWDVIELSKHLAGTKLLMPELAIQLLDKYKHALSAHKENDCGLCLVLGPDYKQPIKSNRLENDDKKNKTMAYLDEIKREEPIKDKVESLSTDTLLSTSFIPTTAKERLAQVAARQLNQTVVRPISQIVPKLIQTSQVMIVE